MVKATVILLLCLPVVWLGDGRHLAPAVHTRHACAQAASAAAFLSAIAAKTTTVAAIADKKAATEAAWYRT